MAAALAQAKNVKVDLAEVRELDTIGAWLIEKMTRRAASAGHRTEMTGVADNYAGLIEEVRQVNRHPAAVVPAPNPLLAKVGELGGAAINATRELTIFLEMLGSLFLALAKVLRRPRSLRLTSLTYQLYRVGFQAIPIMVLITFLIGAIIAQQGFFHFRKFGADSYVVDMVGILVLRELGVSDRRDHGRRPFGKRLYRRARLNEDARGDRRAVDHGARSGRGPDPAARDRADLSRLPILSFIGSMAALYGGGLVAQFYGGMSPAIYLARLHEAISVTHFHVGIIKAPFMALVIGIVACSEGFRVKGSARNRSASRPRRRW